MRALYLMVAGLALSACSQSFSSSDVDWNSQGVRVVTSMTMTDICSDTAFCSNGSFTIVDVGIMTFSAERITFDGDYGFDLILDESGNVIEFVTESFIPTIVDFNDEWIVLEYITEATHPKTGEQWTEGTTEKYFFEKK